MREVAVSRFVSATPTELDGLLTPERLVTYEGSFTVDSVDKVDGATIVTATGPGLELQLRFEQRADGLYYKQAGGAGPFEAMETWVTTRQENDGSKVTMRSQVSLSLSLPFVDRIAAWKRRGELERALQNLSDDC